MSELVLEKNENLPKGWEITNLGLAVQSIVDKDHTTPQYVKFDGIPLISPKDFIPNSIDFSKPKLISKEEHDDICKKCNPKVGDLLYSRIGTIGEVRKVPMNKTFNILHSIVLIRPNSEIALDDYLFHVLQSDIVKNQARRDTKSIGTPDLGITKIRNFIIPLPPLNEQKRIIQKIEELISMLDNVAENLKYAEKKLVNYKNSLFESLFNITGKELSKLSDICEIGTGGTPLRSHSEYYDGIIPWIKTAEVRNNHIVDTEEKITELGLRNSNAKIFPKNSVVLAMYGEGKTRGRCAILDIPASTNQACAVMVCNSEKLDYRYCFYWLQSQYDKIRSKSSGGNQPNLNLGKIKSLEIPLMTLSEQKKIVESAELAITIINNISEQIKNNFQLLSSLHKKILQLAFEGKLVSQDPNDEPISIVLEKIKNKRELMMQNQTITKTKQFTSRRIKNAK